MLAPAVALLPRGTSDRNLVLDPARALLASAGAIALFALTPRPQPPEGAPALMALSACVLLFAGLAWAVRLLRPEDIALLKAAIQRRR